MAGFWLIIPLLAIWWEYAARAMPLECFLEDSGGTVLSNSVLQNNSSVAVWLSRSSITASHNIMIDNPTVVQFDPAGSGGV